MLPICASARDIKRHKAVAPDQRSGKAHRRGPGSHTLRGARALVLCHARPGRTQHDGASRFEGNKGDKTRLKECRMMRRAKHTARKRAPTIYLYLQSARRAFPRIQKNQVARRTVCTCWRRAALPTATPTRGGTISRPGLQFYVGPGHPRQKSLPQAGATSGSVKVMPPLVTCLVVTTTQLVKVQTATKKGALPGCAKLDRVPTIKPPQDST